MYNPKLMKRQAEAQLGGVVGREVQNLGDERGGKVDGRRITGLWLFANRVIR